MLSIHCKIALFFFISLFGLSAILKISQRTACALHGLVVAYTWNREKQMIVALGKEFDMWLFFFILIEECCVVIEKNIGKKLANRISYKIRYKRYLLVKFDGGGGGSKSVKGVQIRCDTGTRVNRL